MLNRDNFPKMHINTLKSCLQWSMGPQLEENCLKIDHKFTPSKPSLVHVFLVPDLTVVMTSLTWRWTWTWTWSWRWRGRGRLMTSCTVWWWLPSQPCIRLSYFSVFCPFFTTNFDSTSFHDLKLLIFGLWHLTKKNLESRVKILSESKRHQLEGNYW